MTVLPRLRRLDGSLGRNGTPALGFQVYARMAAERNDFSINLGDTIYSHSEVGGAPVARMEEQNGVKYGLGPPGALTVALRDARGHPVREATGEACAPFVIAAR